MEVVVIIALFAALVCMGVLGFLCSISHSTNKHLRKNIKNYLDTLKDREKQLRESYKKADEAVAVTTVLEEQIQLLQKQLQTIEATHRAELIAARADAIKKSKSVNHGFSSESFAPMMADYSHQDFRHLGDPVDYIVFSNGNEVRSHGANVVEEIVLFEVKTGKSKMNKIQRRIRDAVVAGRVRFALFNADTKEIRYWPPKEHSPQLQLNLPTK